ncbi:MAG: MoxR family ATPase [Burkholderiaceae bacterium]
MNVLMQAQINLSIRQVHEFLLNVATARPVFIWGAPGIGKSSLVESFAADLGLECVTLLGSQLAPEDLIGIPKIDGAVSRFYPPAMIVREREFVLFIDELNIASQEIQKAFYSLILDKRIGEYRLPAGSIIIGAGNRAQDAALAKQMPSALVNRMVHVHLKASHREWLHWAEGHAIHPWVLDYVRARPTQLATDVPPAREEPFSTPRSWHGVSDALHSFGDAIAPDHLDALLFGSLTRDHAVGFKAFLKQIRNKFSVHKILRGDEPWPSAPQDRDLTYFLTQSLRDLLIKELPAQDSALGRDSRELAQQAKSALKALARIDGELAQLVLTESDAGDRVPDWFVLEIAKDLPRLLQERAEHGKK